MLQYLRCLYTPEEWKACRRIRTVKGGHTSDLRHFWGLNDILHNTDFLPDDLLPGEKNRGDHRHHAIDALVIALTDEMQLKRLGLYKYRSRKQSFPKPWANFRNDAEKAINDITVSHRPIGRVRGALHEDTKYGPVFDQKSHKQQEGVFVVRKSLISLTESEFFKIRDPRIQSLVLKRLAEFGIKPIPRGGKADKAQIKKAFAEPLYLEPEKKKVGPQKHLTEIKKVRILINDQTCRQLNTLPENPNETVREEKERIKENGPFVKPGSNHHICLFEYEDEKGKTIRDAVFTTGLEANRRLLEQHRLIQKKRKELKSQGLSEGEFNRQLKEYRRLVTTKIEPLVRSSHPEKPTARFLFSLKRGEIFKVLDGGEEKLVIFKTAPSTSGQMIFIDVRDAQKEPKKISKRGASYLHILEKLQVDRLGDLTTARD